MAHRNRFQPPFPTTAAPLLTALVLATGSMSAHALDLGRLQILSGVGEPLRAEIEIPSVSAEESRGLRAQIAAPRAFQQAGMEYNPALEGLVSRIENRSGGRVVIVLQGNKPVRDNFIDLILEAQWATGQMARNYALLLNSATDKPTAPTPTAPSPAAAASPVAPATPAPSATPPTWASANQAEVLLPRAEYNTQNVPVYRFETVEAPQTTVYATPSAARANKQGEELPAPPSPAVQANPADRSGRTITVAAGQTASQLAQTHMPGAASQDQVLVAMLKNNPDAFIQNNVNLLRAGAALRMPSSEQAQQTSAEEARQMVLAQSRDFAAHAHRLAQQPLQVNKGANREAEGKVTTKVPARPEAGASQDTLTLSKSLPDKNSQEAQVAAAREAKDSAEQVAQLQKNIEALHSLATAASAAAPATQAAPAQDAPAATATTTTEQDKANAPADAEAAKPLWPWGAGLLAALLGLWWMRRRQNDTPPVFAPSYDDEPATANPSTSSLPSEVVGLDLDLPADPTPQAKPSEAPAQAAPQDTDTAKLALAEQLLAKGDQDLARALLQSVASTGNEALRAKALQLLVLLQ